MGDDGPSAIERPAAASTTLTGCSLAAAIELADPPVWAWRAPDGRAHLGTGEAARVVADGAARFGTVEDGLEALTGRLPAVPGGPRAFVGASFFPDGPSAGTAWDPYPTAVAAVPGVQLGWTPDGAVTLTVLDVDGPGDLDDRLAVQRARFEGASADPGPPPAVTASRSHPDPAAWREAVTSVADRLAGAGVEKAVLAATRELELADAPSAGAVVAALIARHPDCWTFLHAPTADAMFVGATPERLATLDGRDLSTVALAGSIARGRTAGEDARLRRALLGREATRHEQASVVGDIVERLGTVSEAIRVGGRTVRALPDVQHIETPIDATLRGGVGLLDVAARLHPTPAVGGRPRSSALALIREVEAIDRGWYAAPIGVVDPAGNGTLAVAIRSARIERDRATLYAGNGLVGGSEPDEEWTELQLKFRAMAGVFDA